MYIHTCTYIRAYMPVYIYIYICICALIRISQTDCDNPLLFIGKHILHHVDTDNATKGSLNKTDNKLEVKDL